MPVYDYRCNECGEPVSFTFKSVASYDRALAEGFICPHCGAAGLTRVIRRVTVARPGRDYSSMSSGEMLNVLEGGDTREIGRMIADVGQDQALDDPVMHDVGRRLMKGESPERIERDLDSAGPAESAPTSS
jgi:putative FmdB family regulatory protein